MLAIDLSLASLCFGKRQAQAVGVANIAFAQGDILALGGLDRRFDVVDASGVLHHMGDPWAGWRTLLALLRPGGFMRLGLYSRLARAHVNAARVLIADRGYSPSAQDIRRARQEILSLPNGRPEREVVNHLDFFTTSECRDMLFHAVEHQLSLPEIARFIAENDIEFVGFTLDAGVVRRFRARFPPQQALLDLELWQQFETDNPGAFVGMYQFWIRKKGNSSGA